MESGLYSVLLVALLSLSASQITRVSGRAQRGVMAGFGAHQTQRILGGKPAGNASRTDGKPASNWPWIAMVIARARFVWGEPVCAGSLINARHVLTAAHCLATHVIKRDTLQVRLGEFNYLTFIEGKSIDYNVTSIIEHPQHMPNASNHDLALLRLSEDAQFSPGICTIPLPSGPTGDLAGRTVSVAGWGVTSNDDSSATFVLQEVDIIGVSEKTCYEQYLKKYPTLDTSNNFPGGFMVETKICAAAKENYKGPCRGDSGAPLLERGRFQLAGLVHGGFDCRFHIVPVLFTRVSAYLPWIQSNINVAGISNKTQHCKDPFADK